MRGRRKIFLLAGAAFFSLMTRAQEDGGVLHAKDSVIEVRTDSRLFVETAEKVADPLKVLLVTETGRTVSLASMLATLTNKELVSPVHCLVDLDNDGKKELLIECFTGGAHCCDELSFYRWIAPNKYQYTGVMFAGRTVITPEKTFIHSFTEQLGYFYTCYACGYIDTSDAAPIDTREIGIRYRKGKLIPVPGDKELRSVINDNLGKLGEKISEEQWDGQGQDEGARKAFAMNLAVFYYSFGKNIPETKKLFTKYYRYKDAAKVWLQFSKALNYIKSRNSF
jgi:hypothetical protein